MKQHSAKQVIENFIRTEVRKSLNESTIPPDVQEDITDEVRRIVTWSNWFLRQSNMDVNSVEHYIKLITDRISKIEDITNHV